MQGLVCTRSSACSPPFTKHLRLHVARFYSFPPLVLHLPHEIQTLLALFANKPIVQWTIGPYIRVVDIRMTLGTHDQISSLFPALPVMPNVSAIRIRCEEPPIEQIRRIWPNVRRLHVDNPYSMSYKSLRELLTGMPLEVICLDRAGGTIATGAANPIIPHTAQTIEIQGVGHNLFRQVVHPDAPRLERLVIFELGPDTQATHVQAAFALCGNALNELVVMGSPHLTGETGCAP